MQFSPYLRLMRLHQPTGIWLLLWPCWWSITLASHGQPSLKLLALFGIGAVLMRSAGCIINDITDRKLDAQVERTKSRPLASGELGVTQAVALLIILLVLSLLIAIQLGIVVVVWAALSLLPVMLYPWMKRISWWPQLFLGFTFNWGALMGWAAVRGTVEWPAIILYASCLFWTLGYDTIYAHQDKKDDALTGIKSTALRLHDNSKPAIEVFYALAVLGWAWAGAAAQIGEYFYGFLLVAALHLSWQVRMVDLDDPASCKRIFTSNRDLGWLILAGLAAA